MCVNYSIPQDQYAELGYIFIGLHCTSNVNFTLYTFVKSVQYSTM